MKTKNIISFAIVLFLSHTVIGQQEFLLLAPDGASEDNFGNSVAISDSVAVVSAFRDNDAGSNSGAIYVYRDADTAWVFEQKITASDAAAEDRFGVSVDIYDDVIIVGAHQNDDDGTNSGSAYIYRYNGSTWVEEEKITAFDAAAGDEFGFSVSLYGDRAVIGAFKDDDNNTNSGSAYVYKFDGNNWIGEDKLIAPDGTIDDFFSYSIDIHDTTIIIGAYLDDDNGVNSGSAYIFRYDGTSSWDFEQKLTASNGATGESYGFSVAINDTDIIVGAYARTVNVLSEGTVYYYTYNGSTWSEQQIIVAEDFFTDDWFGYSLALSDRTIVMSSFHDDDKGFDSGSLYLYRHDGTEWFEEFKIQASDGATGDQFGQNVAISGLNIITGAINNDVNGSNSGSAYVYPLCKYTPTQQPCVVTVDSTSTFNIVYWSEPYTTFIDSFWVYRNDSLIGASGYFQNDSIHDLALNPNTGAHTYEVSTKNICGNESPRSDSASTILLTGHVIGGDSVRLDWTEAKGLDFPYYRIWRDTMGNGNYDLIHATLKTEFKFTDPDGPTNQPASYYIEVVVDEACSNGPPSALSNKVDPFVVGLNESTGNDFSATVFPNPSTGIFNLRTSELTHVTITNLIGKTIWAGQVKNNFKLDLNNQPNGVYIATFANKSEIISKKLILNR